VLRIIFVLLYTLIEGRANPQQGFHYAGHRDDRVQRYADETRRNCVS